jgi:hypothetical protein
MESTKLPLNSTEIEVHKLFRNEWEDKLMAR